MPFKKGNDRVAICLIGISNHKIELEIDIYGKEFSMKGCIGQVHDRQGSAGFPLSRLKVDEKVTLFMNGDIHLVQKYEPRPVLISLS